MGKKFFLHFYAFQSISSRLRHTFFFENFRELSATREARIGSNRVKKFFLHFYVFQSILSRLRHTFFFENFREREARGSEARGSEATE